VWTVFGYGGQGAESGPEHPNRDRIAREADSGDLVFDRTEIDVGPIREATECSFHFTNKSPVAVKIHSIDASCSCTVAERRQDAYQPGERGVIPVRVTPRTEHIGPQASQIFVDYSSSERRRMRLVVRSKYQPDIVAPAEVTMRCVPGLPARASFMVIDFRDEPLKITRITTSSKIITGVIRKPPGAYLPGWQYEIDVSLRKGAMLRADQRESVTLHTSDPDRPEVVVQVILKQVHRVRLSSGVLVIVGGNDTMSPSGEIYLDDTEGEDVTVGTVNPSHPCLRCEIDQNGAQRPRLRVFYDRALHKLGEGPLAFSLEIRSPAHEERCVKVIIRSR
jgi:hypothetical protein